MIKVLFVCHGNICRSTMAEAIMKDRIKGKKLENMFYIDSAATSREETGNPIYPPARRKLLEKGVYPGTHRARTLTMRDYDEFDYLIGMDHANVNNMKRMYGDPKGKIRLMMEFADINRSISDPWYTDDFESTYQDLDLAINAFLEKILNVK